MAEIQEKDSGGKGGKVRSKKNSGKPDMTPMVDLGFPSNHLLYVYHYV